MVSPTKRECAQGAPSSGARISSLRARSRLPKNQPKTSSRLYILSIEQCASEPAQCIVVDSPDHTYLAAQFIPTHNSGSDHSAVIEAAGGRVSSLDDLIAADGIFDPLRFSKSQNSGAELAASMLMTINPWGLSAMNYEMQVQRAIAYGVERGADCIGVALQIALKDGIAPKPMVEAVMDLATSSPMFRACVGSTNGGQGLRAAQGITYIKVGDAYLDLPAPGQEEVNLNQRIALAGAHDGLRVGLGARDALRCPHARRGVGNAWGLVAARLSVSVDSL